MTNKIIFRSALLLSIALPLVFTSCKKKCDTTHYPVDDTEKDYFLFRTGSWWIYRDSVSGEEDTVRVTGEVPDTRIHYSDEEEKCAVYFEGFYIFESHTNLHGTGPQTTTTDLTSEQYNGTFQSDNFRWYLWGNQPGIVGDSLFWPDDYSFQIIIEVDGRDTIQGRIFDGLYTYRRRQVSWDSTDTLDYLAKYASHSGLVYRHDFRTGRTEELVSCNAVQ